MLYPGRMLDKQIQKRLTMLIQITNSTRGARGLGPQMRIVIVCIIVFIAVLNAIMQA